MLLFVNSFVRLSDLPIFCIVLLPILSARGDVYKKSVPKTH